MERRFYSTGRFARQAAVSERTLRFYDRAGLLAPSGRTEAGYRMYTDEDFPRLQRVLALKFLGLSLDEIKRCLAAGPRRLQASLSQQKAMVREKRAQLDAVLQAIEQAERQLETDQTTFEPVVHVIEVIQMQQKNAWVDKYLTPEQQQTMQELSAESYSESAREKLASRGPWTEEDQQRATEQWAAVATELKRLVALRADPAGREGQAWASAVNDLLGQFTQHDPEIEAGLQTWWKKHSELPAGRRPMPSYTPEEQEFWAAALAASRKQ